MIGQRVRECHEIIRVPIVKRLSVLKRDFEDVLFELRTNRVDKNQKIEKLQLANILIIERR